MSKRLVEMVSLLLQRSWEFHEPEELMPGELIEDLLEAGHDPDQVELAMQIAERLRTHFTMPQDSGLATVKSDRLFELMERMYLAPEVRGWLYELTHTGQLSPLQREEIVERALMNEPDEITCEDVEGYLEDYQRAAAGDADFVCVDPGAVYYH